jgi:hypothetical protein
MDNLFLNRMNSWQEIVKKKQETIFEISIGSLYYFKILLKKRFRFALVFLTIPKPLRQHPIYKKIIHSALRGVGSTLRPAALRAGSGAGG